MAALQRRSSLLNQEFQAFYDLRKNHPENYSETVVKELDGWVEKVEELRKEYQGYEEIVKNRKDQEALMVELTDEFKDVSAEHFNVLYDVCDIIRYYIEELRADKEYEDYVKGVMERRMSRLSETILEHLEN